ncbi:MAG: hypothetical protein ABSB35_17065 [Bryobacteraceae bacterium]
MVLSRIGKITIALAALVTYGMAQEPAKKWKDQAEYDLVQAYGKETTPAGKLAKLDEWKQKYPTSDFADARLAEYLGVYQALNRPKDVFSTASEILKADPNNFGALSAMLGAVYQLGNPPAAADLDTAEKAASHLLADGDTIFAPTKKPANVTDAQWSGVKPQMQAFAQRTLGWIALTRKDNAKAETEFTKALQMNPNDGFVSHWLASAILAQKDNQANPQKQLLAIFCYARAGSYTGAGALDAATQKADLAFAAKAYATYHGSNQGFDQLVATAKTNALPPGTFAVKNVIQLAQEKADADAAAAAANPAGALWKTIKDGLTGDGSAAFWDQMKDTELPGGANGVNTFKVKIVSMKPEMRPKELVVGFENTTTGDITLKLDEALPGKMEPGSEIEIKGTAKAYSKDPYMLTLETDKDGIKGWTGKNPAAKKAAPKKQ